MESYSTLATESLRRMTGPHAVSAKAGRDEWGSGDPESTVPVILFANPFPATMHAFAHGPWHWFYLNNYDDW